jgi:ribosome recycling factor
MQAVVDLVSTDVSSIRTGRATPFLVEGIIVSAYGGTQKLKVNELATITTADAQTILIDPWDKSIIGEIKQAIMAANVGMNPMIDGEIIRISFPPLTTEDREKYVKLLSQKLESGKIMVRQVRADGMHEIKKSFEEKLLTEDEQFAQEKKTQELTDEFTNKIDEMGEKKKLELTQL